MRVAILADHDSRRPDAVANTLEAVFRYAPSDITPHVYSVGPSSAATRGDSGVASRVISLPFYRALQSYSSRKAHIGARLVGDGTEAIHLMSAGGAGLIARRLADRLHLPLIGSYDPDLRFHMTRHSARPRLGALMGGYLRWLYDTCDWVLVPTDTARVALVRSGWREERLVVCRRGVDDSAFSPARRSGAIRRDWRVSESRPALLCAGRLSREEGLPMLVGLKDLLNVHGISHRFVLVGDGRMDRDLQRQLPDAVLTGPVAAEALGEVMASADIFVGATDAGGGTVLQAQACGLPVLVGGCGGTEEDLLDGQTGYICESGNERDYCWRVAQLLTDERRRVAMSDAARVYATNRRWADALRPLFDSYREALHRTKDRRSSTGRLSPRTAARV